MKHLKTFEGMFDFFKKSKPTQPTQQTPTQQTQTQQTQQTPTQEVVPSKSSNPNHQLHEDGEFFDFRISDFAKFVKFCKEKKIYDLILAAADRNKVLLGDDRMKNESGWKNSFRYDLNGKFQISFERGGEVWYARVDAVNATSYCLAVYDEKLKKYVEY